MFLPLLGKILLNSSRTRQFPRKHKDNSKNIEQENRSRERVRLRGTEIHRSTTVPEAPDARDVSNAGNAMDGIIAGLR